MNNSGKLTMVKQCEPTFEQEKAKAPSADDLPSRAIVRLQRIVEKLRDVKMPDPVILNTCIKEVSCFDDKHLAKMNWPGNVPAIYRISASTEMCEKLWNVAAHAAERRKSEAQAAKKSKTKIEYKPPYKMARRIGYQAGQTCLYVGKSDEFTSRMREHLGPISKSTYAMHLSLWAPASLHRSPVKIEYWPLNSLDLSETVIQVLEDTMWEESRPVFGKQGPK